MTSAVMDQDQYIGGLCDLALCSRLKQPCIIGFNFDSRKTFSQPCGSIIESVYFLMIMNFLNLFGYLIL